MLLNMSIQNRKRLVVTLFTREPMKLLYIHVYGLRVMRCGICAILTAEDFSDGFNEMSRLIHMSTIKMCRI